MAANDIKKILTLDSNVFVCAAKEDEPHRKQCLEIIKLIPDSYILCEPSIVYQEECGTIARRVDDSEAVIFAEKIDKLVSRELLLDCDRSFCISSYGLCAEYGICSVDALYLSAAISSGRSSFRWTMKIS